jgi:hypothetical protein
MIPQHSITSQKIWIFSTTLAAKLTIYQLFKELPCSRSFSIVIRFAGFCYGQFMAMRYKLNLVTYVQRPLVIDMRGGTERNLKEITAGSRQRTLAVEGGMQSRTSAMWVSVTVFIEWNVICLWLYTARFFFVSSIKLVNKEKGITKTMCDSVNHTRFPKEDHLPDWECRDKQGNKGDRVEPVTYETRRSSTAFTCLYLYISNIHTDLTYSTFRAIDWLWSMSSKKCTTSKK